MKRSCEKLLDSFTQFVLLEFHLSPVFPCRLQGSTVTPLSVHPGIILQTNLSRSITPMKIPGMGWLLTRMSPKMKNIPEVSIHCLLWPIPVGCPSSDKTCLQVHGVTVS